MLIQCTKKLLDKLGITAEEAINQERLKKEQGENHDPLFSWHANLITIDRRKAMILVNDASKYPIVLYRPQAKDYKKLNDIIKAAIRTVLTEEGFREEIIESYMMECGTADFTRTGSKSALAAMNYVASMISYNTEYLKEDQLLQEYLSRFLGNFMVKIEGKYAYPKDYLMGLLERYAQTDDNGNKKSVLSVEMYQLLVSIILENHSIWRRVMVPANITFKQLHQAIQKVFDWLDYHAHEFEIFNGEKQVVLIAMDEEAYDLADIMQCPIIMDYNTRLNQFLPEYKEAIYHYDLGDYWEHKIEVEKVIHDYPDYIITCLGGEGERPPEDVGGEGGYEDYLEVMADENHEEHDAIALWAEDQKAKKFDLDDVNRKLKYIIKQ